MRCNPIDFPIKWSLLCSLRQSKLNKHRFSKNRVFLNLIFLSYQFGTMRFPMIFNDNDWKLLLWSFMARSLEKASRLVRNGRLTVFPKKAKFRQNLFALPLASQLPPHISMPCDHTMTSELIKNIRNTKPQKKEHWDYSLHWIQRCPLATGQCQDSNLHPCLSVLGG